jgi:hypothetical protein
MDAKAEVFRILKEHRAQLIRHKKHQVYRLPNERIFVIGTTRTDIRGWRNRLALLRRLQSITSFGTAPTKKRMAALSGRSVPQKVFLANATENLPVLRSLAEHLKEVAAASGLYQLIVY